MAILHLVVDNHCHCFKYNLVFLAHVLASAAEALTENAKLLQSGVGCLISSASSMLEFFEFLGARFRKSNS